MAALVVPACTDTEGTTGPTATVTVTPPEVTIGGVGPCDPSYPDVCIPPPPPDLDCPQIERRFGLTDIRVVGSDPHRLDEGGTPGLGCESS